MNERRTRSSCYCPRNAAGSHLEETDSMFPNFISQSHLPQTSLNSTLTLLPNLHFTSAQVDVVPLDPCCLVQNCIRTADANASFRRIHEHASSCIPLHQKPSDDGRYASTYKPFVLEDPQAGFVVACGC